MGRRLHAATRARFAWLAFLRAASGGLLPRQRRVLRRRKSRRLLFAVAAAVATAAIATATATVSAGPLLGASPAHLAASPAHLPRLSLDLRGNRISKTSPTGAALAALGERANLAFQRRSY